MWVIVFKSSICFHSGEIARLFYLFLEGSYCNRQSLCITYEQKLVCEIQLLYTLGVEIVEFF